MLSRLLLKAGSSPTQPQLDLPLAPVTIFVGPNNSGKSRALMEIEGWVTRVQPPDGQVVSRVEFEPWTLAALEDEISKIQVEPALTETLNPDCILLGKLRPQDNSAARLQIHKPGLLNEAQNPNLPNRHQYSSFLGLYTLRLDGKNRLALTDQQPTGDLQKTAPNHLAHLFIDNTARAEVRRIVFEAFGKYLVIDPTNIGHLRLRLSSRPPTDEREEKGWDSVSQAFHGDATLISDASDGVKAFVGMLTTLVAGEPKIMLIDEPEAFLHPSLCARLGKEITSALTGTNRRLFVATHSASFLMGCVQGGAPINIVRLTYDYSTATARLLAKDKLTPLMRNPLLRSIGVLNALFYSAVIVTEADADRAFYQEINERLLLDKDPRGIEGCLFLNAQNKQTVWDIVRPLRELGIPAAGIVDIDVLKEGGAVWQKPMVGAFVPTLSHPALATERSALLKAFEATGKDMKRDGGTQVLSPSDREACTNFFAKLSDYGIFVVPSGEIEAWLPSLSVGRNKATWLTTIFQVMGEDPSTSTYVRPSVGDVWDFIGGIRNWVASPTRKGIPD
ncbi:MAG: AAA family ATPase [Desulfuromonadaceae bacterium]|nr:AAA family ATPase [Desulfuromonadaceae bacterium]